MTCNLREKRIIIIIIYGDTLCTRHIKIDQRLRCVQMLTHDNAGLCSTHYGFISGTTTTTNEEHIFYIINIAIALTKN